MTGPRHHDASGRRRSAALMLTFDGVCYAGDLPVQAFARRVGELLGTERGRGVVAGMRRFLEGRAVPGDPGTDLTAVADGFRAVEVLAAAAGATPDQVSSAYRRSRHDLAASVFAVDPPDGLIDLLDRFADRLHVVVVSNAHEAGMVEVLQATGLRSRIHRVIATADKPACWDRLLPECAAPVGGPDRLVAVGTRWDRDLAAIAGAGGWTGLVDRFDRGDGLPEARATDVSGLLPAVAARLDELTD